MLSDQRRGQHRFLVGLLSSLTLILLLSACSPDLASLIPGRTPRTEVAARAAATAEAPEAIPTETPIAIETPAPTSSPTESPTSSPTMTPEPTETTTPTASPTPLVSAEDVSDVLGWGRTSYAGSIPPRKHNVELATKRLNGVTVPPGGVFSFNQALGPSTLAAGFQVGYGITLANDRPQTVPSVAGGICQVATTLFQAAYWAGLEIVERNYHLYWIPRYGQPPSGVTGLDATVDDPYADLKFRNTTGNWIRIESWADGANVGFTIYGIDPGWKVETEGPIITNRVPASPVYVREQTLTLPPGEEAEVEHAEDGFEVTLARRVYRDGELIDNYRFTSRYRPARNVVLVGVRTLSPPTPEANRTSGANATPTRTPNPIVIAPPLPTAEVIEARPTQGRPTQARPAQGRPTQGRPAQVQPTEIEPAEIEPTAIPPRLPPRVAPPAVAPLPPAPPAVAPRPAAPRPVAPRPAAPRPAAPPIVVPTEEEVVVVEEEELPVVPPTQPTRPILPPVRQPSLPVAPPPAAVPPAAVPGLRPAPAVPPTRSRPGSLPPADLPAEPADSESDDVEAEG